MDMIKENDTERAFKKIFDELKNRPDLNEELIIIKEYFEHEAKEKLMISAWIEHALKLNPEANDYNKGFYDAINLYIKVMNKINEMEIRI